MIKHLFFLGANVFLILVIHCTFIFANGNTLHIGIQEDQIPLEYIDDQGEPRGIIVDLWRLWSVKTGSPVQFIPLLKETAASALETGEVDVISNLGNLTGIDSDSLRNSLPLYDVEYYIFSHKNSQDIRNIGSFKNFKIGVIQNSLVGNWEEIGLPSSLLKKYPTMISLYHGLANGEIQSAVASEMLFRVALAKTIGTIQISQSVEPVTSKSIGALVANDNEALHQKIKVGFEKITAAETQTIKSRWTGASIGHRIPWQLYSFGILVGATFIIGLLLWFWNFNLKEKINLATKDLWEKHQQLIVSEEELTQLRNYLSNIIDSMPSILIGVNLNGEVSQWNKMSENFTGITDNSAIGQNLCDVFPEMRSVIGKIAESIQINKTKKYINKPFRKGDGIVYQNLTIYPLIGSSVKGAVIRLDDVTKEHDLKEQLSQAQKMEAIGTLAGGIAHDFNNILSAILGYTELAQGKASVGSEIWGYQQEVFKAAVRASELVKQILTFSRQSEQERVRVNIHLIVKEALKLIRALIPSTVEIRQKIDEQSGVALVDPTRIHQVIMNLCTNGYHAMRETGGVLGVELSQVDLKKDDIKVANLNLPVGSYVVMSISDNGTGMDQATLSRIFEPFFTTKATGEGSGMGLAIVHGIIKSHDGHVSVYSEIGKGTSVKIYLPKVEEGNESILNNPEFVNPSGSERILIVDDEETILQMAKQALERLGYRVTSMENSAEALQRFKSEPENFDLVLTDMTMPHLNGAELAQEMLGVRPGIPIIMCSGFSDIMSEEKARSIGIREYVMKPIVINTLAKTIRKVLEA